MSAAFITRPHVNTIDTFDIATKIRENLNDDNFQVVITCSFELIYICLNSSI